MIPVYNERATLRALLDRVCNAPIPLELEMVAVDDASTDGSFEILQEIAESNPRLHVFRHEQNRGKGAAIRTAIANMQGDVAIVQDADLEYDPREYPRLLQPILSGKAIAVFGSRFLGAPRRAMFFWNSLANRWLTTACNLVADLNLTDMETCYKMVRADVLRNLRLSANSFTLEPELTTRLAQWGGPIYEVPVSYSGRTHEEGKKIRAVDGLKALVQIFRSGIWDRRFTENERLYALAAQERLTLMHAAIAKQLQPFWGERVMHWGAGLGGFSSVLPNCDRLTLLEEEPLCLPMLQCRFRNRENVFVEQFSGSLQGTAKRLPDTDPPDCILITGALERAEDPAALLQECFEQLSPGGRCFVVAAAGPLWRTKVDATWGYLRRYRMEQLKEQLEAAGFTIIHARQMQRLGGPAWWIWGKILRRNRIGPTAMKWGNRFAWRLLDRILPLPGGMLLVAAEKTS